jgi:hypothetical protein
MNRLTEYIKAQTNVRTELQIAEAALERGDLAKSLRHTQAAVRGVLTAQANLAHRQAKRKPPKSKLAPRKPAQTPQVPS